VAFADSDKQGLMSKLHSLTTEHRCGGDVVSHGVSSIGWRYANLCLR
jgi:hypothetical protein